VTAALAGLDGVISVEHETGTDVFVVQHHGPLSDAAHAVDRVVILRWARRGLEKVRQRIRATLHRR
jgi:hypothetical protein